MGKMIDIDAVMDAFLNECTSPESEKCFSCHDIDRILSRVAGENSSIEEVSENG